MRRNLSPIALCLIASTLVLASSCASKPVQLANQYPPAADLKVEPDPVAPAEIATSEAAYEDYNDAVAAWGKRGWAAVARLCRFSAGMGMAIDCPAPVAAQGGVQR